MRNFLINKIVFWLCGDREDVTLAHDNKAKRIDEWERARPESIQNQKDLNRQETGLEIWKSGPKRTTLTLAKDE